jgi:hypothetical protein
MLDQPINAFRLLEAGVATPAIPFAKLTAEVGGRLGLLLGGHCQGFETVVGGAGLTVGPVMCWLGVRGWLPA